MNKLNITGLCLLSVSVILFAVFFVIVVSIFKKYNESTCDLDAEVKRFEYINDGSLKGCVDGAGVISLEEDAARLELALDHILASGLQDVKPFVVKRSPKGGEYGCFESHQLLAQHALKKGYSSFLFFEDDARLGAPIPEGVAEEIKQELESLEPTIIYLGYASSRPFLKNLVPLKHLKHVFEIMQPITTHAVAMNKPAMEKVVELEIKGPYDWALRDKVNARKLAVYPMIFHQCDCGSSVTGINLTVQKTLGFPMTMRLISHTSRHPALMWLLGGAILAASTSIVLFTVSGFQNLWLKKK